MFLDWNTLNFLSTMPLSPFAKIYCVLPRDLYRYKSSFYPFGPLFYSRNKGRGWSWFSHFSLGIGCASDIIRFIFSPTIRELLLNGLENYEIQNKAIRMSAGREPHGSVCTWVCARTLPGIRLRNIIYQQSLCLISHQSTESISSQGCSQPPSSPSASP